MSTELLQLTVRLSRRCVVNIKPPQKPQNSAPLLLAKAAQVFQTQPQLITRNSRTAPWKPWPLLTYFHFMFFCTVHCDIMNSFLNYYLFLTFMLSPKCFEPHGFILRETVVCTVKVCFTSHTDECKTYHTAHTAVSLMINTRGSKHVGENIN